METTERNPLTAIFVAVFSFWVMAAPAGVYEGVPPGLTGSDVLTGGMNPWAYWGTFVDNQPLREPHWRGRDDVVDGWDWSLPPQVKPSERAMVRWGMHGWRKLGEAGFPEGLTLVDELWWRWRQIEPEEGRFEFAPLRKAIEERLEAGCDGIIIRMLGSVWQHGTPEDWEDWKKTKTWMFNRWSAPRWLENYHVRKIEEVKDKGPVVHLDILDPVYHEKYLRFVKAFGESGLPALSGIKGLIICGMSYSNGEEAAGLRLDTPEKVQRYRERLAAWITAFGPHRNKLVSMADFPNDSGLPDLGLGSRDGFVEMYLYHTNDPDRGQFIDKNRYLCVDEFFPVFKRDVIFGDENEEYSRDRWADKPGKPGRFGPVESFNYRYFTSMLRLLQMRRNYLYTGTNAVIPEMLWFVCHELARRVADAPDAWCFLRESYLSPWANRKPHQSPGAVKNFERWLYQRDRGGQETTPAVRIPHALKRWWLRDEKRPYDYVARTGRRIGFAVDDHFLSGRARSVAVKVTWYDGHGGEWRLAYQQEGGRKETPTVTADGADRFKTATFFLSADFVENGKDYDFEILTHGRVPISFVRVIKTERK